MLAWSTSRSPFRCWADALQLACSEAYGSEWALVREAHTGEPDDSGHYKPKFSLYRPIPQWLRGNGPVKRARFRPRVAKGLASGGEGTPFSCAPPSSSARPKRPMSRGAATRMDPVY